MDVFHFCWINLLNESKKCRIVLDKNTCNVKDESDENYDKPINRVSYLYKYGTFNILFFNKCLNEFVLRAPNATEVLERLGSTKNLNICSLSTGPGTDIIGLLYGLHQFGKPLKDGVNFKIISKYGGWRNLVTEMINSQIARISESSTCKLIQADVLKPLSTKAQKSLKNADVILMCRVFPSHKATQNIIRYVLRDIFQLLKPGALVFFVSSQKKLAYFQELSTCGSFLFGPTEVGIITGNLPYNEKIVNVVGVQPLTSGSSFFAVWQKSETSMPETSPKLQIDFGKNPVGAAKINQSISKLPENISVLKMDISKENIEKCVSPKASNINPSTSCDEPNFQLKLLAAQSNVVLEAQCKRENNVESDGSSQSTSCNSSGDNANNEYHPKSHKSLFSKINNIATESQHKKEGNGAASVASLLKSFESLVSNFEDFVSSQERLKSSPIQKDSAERDSNSSSFCNLSQSHCEPCASSCVKCCQPYNQPLAVCTNAYSSCQQNGSNYGCSIRQISTPRWSVLQQSSGPCLVIPLSNLCEDTICHILSLVSQNNSK